MSEKLNYFKFLVKLELDDFNFQSPFNLILPNLKILSLINCHNICLDEIEGSNTKELIILYSTIINKTILKFPELKKLEYKENNINLKDINDLTSLAKIKYLTCEFIYFNYIESASLIKLNLESEEQVIQNINKEIEINVLKKIITSKNLKTIKSYQIYNINHEDINNIPGENTSLEYLDILFLSEDINCDILNLQKKFPNLTELCLKSKYKTNNEEYNKCELKENPDCEIIKLKIDIYGINIKLSCASFENLQILDILISPGIIDKNFFLIFDDNCSVEFNCLSIFKFGYSNNFEFLENISNNLKKMPNLEEIWLGFKFTNLNKELYLNCVRKIISYKISDVYISFCKCINLDYYEIKELEELNFDLNYDYDNIEIQKHMIYKNKKNYFY